METLASLQDLQLRGKLSAESPQVRKLRAEVPEGILEHFDRLMARGKKGVAVVHAGVCSECHLRLSSGTLGSITHPEGVHICDNCGRYLLVPLNQPVPWTSAPRSKKSRANPVLHAH